MAFSFFKKDASKTERNNKENDEETYQNEKEFFLKYHGIGFYMSREGGKEYDDYKSKNVPKELEYEWMEEYRDDLIKKIENESNEIQIVLLFSYYADTIGELCRSSEPILYMLEFAEKNKSRLDSFSRIRFSEILLKGMNGYQYSKSPDPAVIEKVKLYAFQMLRNVIDNPIVVSEENQNDLHTHKYDFSDANLMKRIQDNLKQWENK